jgi:hypothetical protein
MTLHGLHPQIPNYAQACVDLYFPFFIVEFKSAAGTGGSVWAAANQCAGGSVVCLQAVDQLNKVLGEAEAASCNHVANFCYSLAIDNNLAQLHVSWKDGTDFHIQRVASFLLSDPEHFIRLHRYVAAILEWGQGRLGDIRLALDYIGAAATRAESTTQLGKRSAIDDGDILEGQAAKRAKRGRPSGKKAR